MEKKRRGPASAEEIRFISENVGDMEIEDIANQLNRTIEFVKNRIAQAPLLQQLSEMDEAIARLHKSHFWVETKKALLTTEVPFFEQQWAKLIEQFSSNEIVATDEMMIKDLILLEINGVRANTEKKKVLETINELERQIKKEKMTMENPDLLELLKRERNSLLAALPALSKEHLEYQHRKDQKLRDLKATRDLRFKHIEESKRNVFQLIKDLDVYDKRKKEGRWMELMRMGADKIEEAWKQSTEFEDGTYNKPFLSPEGELEDEQDSQTTRSKEEGS